MQFLLAHYFPYVQMKIDYFFLLSSSLYIFEACFHVLQVPFAAAAYGDSISIA